MNFTSEAKREMLSPLPRTEGERNAAICALLLTSGTAAQGRFEFVTENERAAEFFVRLVEDGFRVSPGIEKAAPDPRQGRTRLTLACEGEKADGILRAVGFGRSPAAYAAEERCAIAFLKGAFLGSGSCTLPRGGAKTGYHLEFVLPDPVSAEEFCALLAGFELLPKTLVRGEKTVVYFKSGDALSDFFSVVGAENALNTLGRVSSERAASNNDNRISNCVAGNADRTAIASTRQVAHFLKLRESGVLAVQSEQLRAAATARMEHPSLSLEELAVTLNVSKSCLYHRLRKLMQLQPYGEEEHD